MVFLLTYLLFGLLCGIGVIVRDHIYDYNLTRFEAVELLAIFTFVWPVGVCVVVYIVYRESKLRDKVQLWKQQLSKFGNKNVFGSKKDD